ncbi:MAG TPA: alpha/beta hydrolase [Gemmataceae bacterium]|nr:alpha/beta hydrolase [Gemmataceae bacterium]
MTEPTPATAPPRTVRQRVVRWIKVVCLGLALGYVGKIAVLMMLENSLVYHPAGPEDWTPPPSSLVQDVELTSAAGDTIHGWWFPLEGSTGALLYFHGNAGNLSARGHWMSVLREQLGQSVLIVDYPGYGKSSGSPNEAGCYAAADAAYDWLTKNQKIPGENILIYGASLGGGIAVDLASRKPHRALILIKTFTSAPDVGQEAYPWLPIRWLMRNRFDSLDKLANCKQPIFIAHGDADRVVPFSHGERLYAAAPGAKKFLRIPGGDHNDSLPGDFFEILKPFLAEATGK